MEPKVNRYPLAWGPEIAALAGKVAESYFPNGRVDPEVVAQRENIAFSYLPIDEESDGFLVHEAGRFYILCNNRVHARGSPRSRFTFAHELGHYFIEDHRQRLIAGQWPAMYCRTEFSSSDLLEMEADCFAANLLLPEKTFRAAFAAESSSGLAKIAVLAEHFGVSVTATAYRAIGLDLLLPPAAVFRWNQLGKSAGRRMSDDTAGLRPEYCGLVDEIPPGTVTAWAIANLAVGTRTGKTPVMRWFPKLTGYDRCDDTMLVEEVVSLGHHGWLTLLFNQEVQELRYGQLPKAASSLR
jgi:Zn-dependent peptidase ImmA (M78 family)